MDSEVTHVGIRSDTKFVHMLSNLSEFVSMSATDERTATVVTPRERGIIESFEATASISTITVVEELKDVREWGVSIWGESSSS